MGGKSRDSSSAIGSQVGSEGATLLGLTMEGLGSARLARHGRLWDRRLPHANQCPLPMEAIAHGKPLPMEAIAQGVSCVGICH